MKQKYHIIEYLLNNKADPNEVNMSGWNCLMSGVNYFHEESAVMLLLLLQVRVKTVSYFIDIKQRTCSKFP